MGERYFVMMSNQPGDSIIPLVNGDGDVMLWDTAQEARTAANANMFAAAFGYEVFQRGSGI